MYIKAGKYINGWIGFLLFMIMLETLISFLELSFQEKKRKKRRWLWLTISLMILAFFQITSSTLQPMVEAKQCNNNQKETTIELTNTTDLRDLTPIQKFSLFFAKKDLFYPKEGESKKTIPCPSNK